MLLKYFIYSSPPHVQMLILNDGESFTLYCFEESDLIFFIFIVSLFVISHVCNVFHGWRRIPPLSVEATIDL